MKAKCKKCGEWYEVRETKSLFCPECREEIEGKDINDLDLPEISNKELANLELEPR